jgi:hypothetical protein
LHELLLAEQADSALKYTCLVARPLQGRVKQLQRPTVAAFVSKALDRFMACSTDPFLLYIVQVRSFEHLSLIEGTQLKLRQDGREFAAAIL